MHEDQPSGTAKGLRIFAGLVLVILIVLAVINISQVSGVQSQLRGQQDQLADMRSQSEAFQGILNETQRQMEDLQSRLTDIGSPQPDEEARAQIASLEAEIENLQNELAKIATLESQISSLQAEIANLSSEEAAQTTLTSSLLPVNGRSTQAVAADFDGDGFLDVYIPNGYNYGEDNYYLINRGDGSFDLQSLASAGLPTGGASTGAVAADFDGDGDFDLYVTNNLDQDNWYLLNDGSGRFELQDNESVGLPARGFSASKPVAADFNGDGNLDLYIPNSGTDFLALSRGDGTFESQDLESIGLPTSGTSTSALAADFNKDGNLDLFITNGLRAQSGAPIGEDNIFALGNGDGTFTTQDLKAAGLTPGGTSTDAVAADFNGDGNLDLLVINADTYGQNSYALGNGDGTFSTKDIAAVGLARPNGTVGNGATVIDFGSDGDLDLYIANGGISTNQPDQFFENSNGTFSPIDLSQWGLPTRGSGYNPLAADFNKDGITDLLVTNVNFIHGFFYFIGLEGGGFKAIPVAP